MPNRPVVELSATSSGGGGGGGGCGGGGVLRFLRAFFLLFDGVLGGGFDGAGDAESSRTCSGFAWGGGAGVAGGAAGT